MRPGRRAGHPAPSPRRGRIRGVGAAAWVLAGALSACAPGLSVQDMTPDPPSEADRARYVRYQIQSALSFRDQDRLESAERALEAALRVQPENARAHRLLATVLEDLGRMAEAERHRERADALDPPPPLPPDEPLDVPSQGVLVVLPPPGTVRGQEAKVEGGWPGGEAVGFVMRRLATRLPEAEVVTADPDSVQEVRALFRRMAPRAVLSVQVDRAFCGDSEKDGPFAVAWLRVAAAGPDGLVAPARQERAVELLPRERGCVRLVLGRALEAALARPDVRQALAAPPATDGWPHAAVRQLFPALSERIARHVERGRARLATGRVQEALEAFRRAAEIDPGDPDVAAYVNEAELTLRMAEELAADAPADEPAGGADLEPQLTAAQRRAAERLLAEERRHRDELLAALLVLDAGGRIPPPGALARLRSAPVDEPGAVGSRLARTLTDAPLEVRAYFAPDGGTLARYWLAGEERRPVLRAEDSDDDGRVDRWEGYVDGARRHVWEDRQGLGSPDLHMVFTPDGGPERVEVDSDGDGRTERLFRYENGVLASESRDTDDDGVLDRVEHFDPEGYVVRREDDLDGDGETDVRTFYARGSLVRREILNPDLLDLP